MTSDKNMKSDTFSINNIGLILGPEQSGKSYLIKKSLMAFERKHMSSKKVVGITVKS